jgi:hypothetical protein
VGIGGRGLLGVLPKAGIEKVPVVLVADDGVVRLLLLTASPNPNVSPYTNARKVVEIDSGIWPPDTGSGKCCGRVVIAKVSRPYSASDEKARTHDAAPRARPPRQDAVTRIWLRVW